MAKKKKAGGKKRKFTKAMKDAFVIRMKKARSAGKPKRGKMKKQSTKSAVKKSNRKTTVKREVPLARKRRSSKKGGTTKKGRRRSRSAKSFGLKGKGIVGNVKNAAVAVAGGIVAGMAANKLPIPNPLLKAASPLIMGLALMATVGRKNQLVAQMATGMMVMGGVATIRAQFPNVPLLAGEDEIVITPDMLGYTPTDDLLRGVEEFDGVEEFEGDEAFVTAANL